MKKPCRVLFVMGLIGCQSDINLIPDSSLTSTPNPPDLSAVTKEDRIVQVTVPSVDVLWVIDNSCSMIEEQIALTDNFGKFIQYFVGWFGLSLVWCPRIGKTNSIKVNCKEATA